MRQVTPNILDELMPTTSETSEITAALRWNYDQLGADAADVRRHAVEIKRNERRASEQALEAGLHLIAVKERLDHGQWGDWLEVEFAMSERTAQRMMAAAAQFDGKSDTVSFLGTSVLYLLAGDSVPEPAREAVIDAAKSGERMTKAKAKAIIAKHKPAPKAQAGLPASFEPINMPMPSQYGTVQAKVEIVPADDTPLPEWATGDDSRENQLRRYADQFQQTITALDGWGQITGHNTDILCCLRELRKLIGMTQRELSLLRGEVVEEAWGE